MPKILSRSKQRTKMHAHHKKVARKQEIDASDLLPFQKQQLKSNPKANIALSAKRKRKMLRSVKQAQAAGKVIIDESTGDIAMGDSSVTKKKILSKKQARKTKARAQVNLERAAVVEKAQAQEQASEGAMDHSGVGTVLGAPRQTLYNLLDGMNM